jgi:hypothetical protein
MWHYKSIQYANKALICPVIVNPSFINLLFKKLLLNSVKLGICNFYNKSLN